jgi:SSS family solute:Na+ symporter
LFGHYTTIFQGINKLISYVAPPITAVFLLGVFWKRASGKAAFITLVGGTLLGLVAFYLDWNNIYHGDFMLTAFWLLIACMVIMVATSSLFPEPLKPGAELLVWESWREPLRSQTGGFRLADYRVANLAIFAVFVGLYFAFR